MTSNPQANPQKDQPDVRATNPDANRQFGQQNRQNKQDAYPQKAGFDPSKKSARPEDEENEENGSDCGTDKGADKSSDPYKKPMPEKH